MSFKMKRTCLLLLALCMAFVMIACDGDEKKPQPEETTLAQTDSTAAPSEGNAPAEEPSEESTPAEEPSEESTPAEEPSEESTPAEEPSEESTPEETPSENSTTEKDPEETKAPELWTPFY